MTSPKYLTDVKQSKKKKTDNKQRLYFQVRSHSQALGVRTPNLNLEDSTIQSLVVPSVKHLTTELKTLPR